MDSCSFSGVSSSFSNLNSGSTGGTSCSSGYTDGSSCSTGGSSSGQWIIPGATFQASIPCDNVFVDPEPVVVDIGHGSVFRSKDAMISCIALYHLKNCLEFRNKRSDTGRYIDICKFEERCSFCVRARAVGSVWKIHAWVPHTCQRDLRRGPHAKVSSKAIAAHVGPNLLQDGYELRPRDIQGQLQREFGVNLTYSAALAGRNLALNAAYGDHDKSFQLVPKYLYILQFMNPGSNVDIQTRADGSMEYCYFCLHACMLAFRSCRPIVVIDATHLKGKYKGVLFVASTKDANEQIVPLAFCVGDKENDKSWGWFLLHVRESLGVRDDMLIVGDQHVSINNAVRTVFPGVAFGLCSYHIQGHLRGEDVIEFFQAAANAYRVEDFEIHMSSLKSASAAAHSKLLKIDPVRWARSKCPVRRYSFGTSNAVECLNSRLKWARKLPICSLLEYARNLVQEWFCNRRSIAASRSLELSEYATRRLEAAMLRGRVMRVEPISNSKFKVISGSRSYIVDIHAMSCSCKVFQMDLIPCSHATRALSHMNQVFFGYVNSCYTTRTWHEIYASDVMPVPDPSEWHVPDEVNSLVVGTPSNPKQAGRPRRKRFQVGDCTGGLRKSVGEGAGSAGVVEGVEAVKESILSAGELVAVKESRQCSRCHEKGHYLSTCKAFLEINCEEADAKRARKAKSCSICGVVGHTRRTCLDPNRF